MGERNKRILLEQLQLDKNRLCADCNAENPEWASSNIGVFVCVNCSGIHRMLGTHITRVKSCRLDQWNDEAVQFMCERGNDFVNAELEQYLPHFYQKPQPTDPQMYKEHFIHAKYEKKEFSTPEGANHYSTGCKNGTLWKRGKDDKQFKPRRFVLNLAERTLKYYVKPESKGEPKQTISLSTLTVSLAPEKINHSNGLQLSFTTENNTRQIYLYADDAKVAVDWYIYLRAASFNLIREANPKLSNSEIMTKLNNSLVKQGWLQKTGPKHTEPFRKRWFALENRRLLYFVNALDAHPKGEIFIGNCADGYMVRDGLPQGHNEPGYGFTVTTPHRDYLMCCDDKEEQKSWINEIRTIIMRPLDSQDSADPSEQQIEMEIDPPEPDQSAESNWVERSSLVVQVTFELHQFMSNCLVFLKT